MQMDDPVYTFDLSRIHAFRTNRAMTYLGPPVGVRSRGTATVGITRAERSLSLSSTSTFDLRTVTTN